MFYHFDIIAATKFIVFRTNTQIFLKIITADLKKKKNQKYFRHIFQMTAIKRTDSNTQLKFGVFLSMN